MAYIDVRGVYPSYVTSQYSISLEYMIRLLNIPESAWRSITPELVEFNLFGRTE